MIFFRFKKISSESGSLLKKLDSFGLEARKDLEAATEVMMEALMEVTKAPAREVGRAAAAKSTTVMVRIKCQIYANWASLSSGSFIIYCI